MFKICELWSCDMNSTLGSVVPLAMFRYLRGVTTDLHDTAWESDHFSLRTRVHNWPFRCSDCSHESKQTMPWSSNDTCTTSKNCRMQKYCLVLNITWRKKYLVWIFSAATEARETTQASSNDTCTTSRGGSTTGSTTTSGEKIWCEKTFSGDVGNG